MTVALVKCAEDDSEMNAKDQAESVEAADLGMIQNEDPPPMSKKVVPKKYPKKASKKKKGRSNNTVSSNNDSMGDKVKSRSDSLEESEKPKIRKKTRSKSVAEICSNQIKSVKFYSPLPLFVKLQLEPAELYNRFTPYVLYTEQLRQNGFPLECPNNPGKVVFGSSRFRKNSSEDPQERTCSRCDEKFTVTEDGVYHSNTLCYYHNGKRLSAGGVSGAGAYSCCGSNSPKGCLVAKHHVSANIAVNNAKFVKTREKRQKQLPESVYALDCEMCYTVQGLEVTRISVVGTDGLTVYDTYVMPENPVIDYNTYYSGVTAKHLKDVKTTLADVQAFLLKLLTAQTILVGHGLENDLRALHLIHKTVVDTSVVFPHHFGYPFKTSLKSLAATYLKQTIQQGDCGHDSVEDARTCIELMLWKIDADSYLYDSVFQQSIAPAVIPQAQTWPVSSLSINPAFVPCNFGYWVAPVGAGCDF